MAQVRRPLAVRLERRGPRAAARRPGSSARFQNICISREAGAGGGAIARMVGQRLGWKVFDHELLEAIAHRMELPIDDVRTFDELAPSVIQDWLLPLREEHYAPQEAYLDHLAKLIEAIGRAGQSVLVGRGAGFLLPRETTLSVRIIAPLRARSLRLAERMGVSVRTARRAAKDLDAPPRRVRSHDAPDELRRPAQLRHRPRLAQPGPRNRRRGHLPRRRRRPPRFPQSRQSARVRFLEHLRFRCSVTGSGRPSGRSSTQHALCGFAPRRSPTNPARRSPPTPSNGPYSGDRPSSPLARLKAVE